MNTSYTLTSDITLRLLKHLCFSGSWSKFGVADGRLSRLGSFSWSWVWSCWGSGPFLVSAPLSRCLVPTGLGAMVATCRYVRWVKCVALSWEWETQGNTRITLNYSIWQESLTIWKKKTCLYFNSSFVTPHNFKHELTHQEIWNKNTRLQLYTVGAKHLKPQWKSRIDWLIY